MPMLEDATAGTRPVLVPINRTSADNLSPHSSNARPLSLMSPTLSTSGSQGKKSRPKSFSGLLLQHEQQRKDAQPQLTYQPKSARWASRGGIGSKNEMMIDLETSGVFVPSNAKRLRPEFVYRTIILCADEIRNRGLTHPNIFYNPSPKKTISAMIALLTDQERADSYPIQCLRIDTVANLMLNLLSQMSNPVIPYAVMEFYFKHGASTPSSPSMPASSVSGGGSVSSTIESTHPRLPSIPPLPSLMHSQKFASSTVAWSRQCFDLPLFLDSLPSLNRVILLEVLHLCAEILNNQIHNNLTMNRLIQQIAPALFSTVSDQKVLEQVIGSRRCSIHDSAMSAHDGSRAENYLFTVILSRFMYMTSMTNEFLDFSLQPVASRLRDGSACSMGSSLPGGENGPYASIQAAHFRKSQEQIQQAQQEYYHKMEMVFQEMELQGQPSQHFGQYMAASPAQGSPQGKLAYRQSGRPTSQEGGLVEQMDFNLPQPSMAVRPHRDHTWHDRCHDANRQIVV
ncbi:hypothetical protein BG003_004680 [Podila horticola]|nr:hypothetical protein BG003_004680 [Podila horticola]